jgi:hypothetical protein
LTEINVLARNYKYRDENCHLTKRRKMSLTKRRIAFAGLGGIILPLLSGCAAAPPTGPDIMVLPGDGKSYEQFQQDDYVCRDAAARSIGLAVQAAQSPGQNGAATAAVGTAIGAAAGALIGAAAGNAGAGAAAGAGTGLVAGSAQGAANVNASGAELQWRYDVAYAQCMAAKGNKVPEMSANSGYYSYGSPPAYAYYPGYGYFYPPVTFVYGFGWYDDGGHWHDHGGGWHGDGWHGGPPPGPGGGHPPGPGGGSFHPPGPGGGNFHPPGPGLGGPHH